MNSDLNLKPDTVIVIAARNEADNIDEVVTRARRYGAVIVVDDASTDGTATRARAAGADVVFHTQHTHIKQAFADGFKAALALYPQYVVQLDAGLSFDPDEIPRLLAGLDNADYVLPWRDRRHWYSYVVSAAVRLVTGMPYHDLTGGFKAYRANVLRVLFRLGIMGNLRATAHAFQFELTYRIYCAGYRVTEVPVSYTPGRSSANWRVAWEAMKVLACIRS